MVDFSIVDDTMAFVLKLTKHLFGGRLLVNHVDYLVRLFFLFHAPFVVGILTLLRVPVFVNETCYIHAGSGRRPCWALSKTAKSSNSLMFIIVFLYILIL